MQTTLRSLILAPIVLAAAALTANTAAAETKVNVPFDFTVAGQHCPAGLYSIQKNGLQDSVKLEGNSHIFTWLIGPGDPAPTDRRVILNFDTLGSSHVLRSVQYGPMITPRLDEKHKQSTEEQEQTVQGQ
ncbi:MAG: hypothetical protein WBE72_22670 [Terracidiphilus sp.]